MKKILLTLLTLIFLQLAANAQRINVAFTIDNNYPLYTMLAINSILANNNSNSDYTFYIVENNVTDKNKKKMQKYVEKQNQEIKFIHFDTKVIDNGRYFYTFSEGHRITPIGMARIMLPAVLPKELDRVLYIDGDILVTDDLVKLYNSDLSGKAAGMSKNIGKLEYKMYKFDTYYNSGMILMDLNKWRKDDIPTQMLSYLEKNLKYFIYIDEKDNSKYLYPDQDLINIVLDGKIKTLEQCWNNQTIRDVSLIKFYIPGIIHYIGPVKPWDFPNKPSRGVEMYYDYWLQSPLAHYFYICRIKHAGKRLAQISARKCARYKLIIKSMKDRKFTFFY